MEIIDILNSVKNEQLKEKLVKCFLAIEPTMRSMPSSIRFHHSDKGGLYRHTLEVMSIALNIYRMYKNDMMKHLILEDDVILVSFIHDMEKLNKYKANTIYEPEKKWVKGYKETEFNYNYDKVDMNDCAYVVHVCAEYGIRLEEKHLNALTFAHGGWSLDKGRMNPLAVVVHTADLMSTWLYGDK